MAKSCLNLIRRVSLLFIFLLFATLQVKGQADQDLPIGGSEIVGLASPVQLTPQADTIVLSDYFLDPMEVDSLKVSEPLQITRLQNPQRFVIFDEPLHPLAELTGYVEGRAYHILMKKNEKKKVELSFSPDESANVENVALKGEMNNWNASASPMKNENGEWHISMHLRPGTYEYLYVVDGNEMLDPENPDKISNGMGGFNSVLKVAGPSSDEEPIVYTDRISGQKVYLRAKKAERVWAYWQNQRIPARLTANHIELTLPGDSKNADRSYIRVWTSNQHTYSNQVLIPLQNGHVLKNADNLNRTDFRASVLYFMMVDRFKNGRTDNDRPLNRPDVLLEADYYGGDLPGITKKIRDGYFEKLGVNMLWLSPITQNPEGAYGLYPDPKTKFSGYHGYWPVSSTKVDYRYGTEQELRELLETAHKDDNAVILDYVANHVHEEHPVYKKHPEWATDLYLEDSTLNTQKWDEHRLTTWFDTFMPTLDFSKPEVVNTMTDSALYWMKDYQFDGFRHDATKHIQLDFWRTLTRKIRDEVVVAQDQKIYQIGETYGSRELIGSYVGSGLLDGQFDFNVYDDAIATFALKDQSFERLHGSLMESLSYYGYHNLMGYITGNQDRARFISYAGGALSFEEDAKEAGWKREVGVGDSTGYDKMAQLMAFNMTIPGVPVIYYGDEIGMPGGNDPDNRKMMRFKDLIPEEEQLRDITSQLVHLRREYLPLTYGTFEPVKVSDKVYVYARKYFDQTAVVVFNKDRIDRRVSFSSPFNIPTQDLKAEFGHEFQTKRQSVQVDLPPFSFEIITNRK